MCQHVNSMWISRVILYARERIAVYSPRNCYGTWISRVILLAWEVAVYSQRNCYGTWISQEVAVYSLGNSRDNSRQIHWEIAVNSINAVITRDRLKRTLLQICTRRQFLACQGGVLVQICSNRFLELYGNLPWCRFPNCTGICRDVAVFEIIVREFAVMY